MELHSSDELVPPSDSLKSSQNFQSPKSSELGFNTALQTSETDHRDSIVMDDEELKNQNEQQHKQFSESFGGRFCSENTPDVDGEMRRSLDEEIHQVIYTEALNEAVMNLALEERNASESELKFWDSVNEEVHHLDQAEGIEIISGLGEGDNTNNVLNKKEAGGEIKNDEISEVTVEGEHSYGKSGDVDENEWQNGKEGDESEDEENYATVEGESGWDHTMSNEDGRDNGGRNYGRRVVYPVRPDAEDCAYYMKTGTCKFGATCKFNHPPRRRNQVCRCILDIHINLCDQLISG